MWLSPDTFYIAPSQMLPQATLLVCACLTAAWAAMDDEGCVLPSSVSLLCSPSTLYTVNTRETKTKLVD